VAVNELGGGSRTVPTAQLVCLHHCILRAGSLVHMPSRSGLLLPPHKTQSRHARTAAERMLQPLWVSRWVTSASRPGRSGPASSNTVVSTRFMSSVSSAAQGGWGSTHACVLAGLADCEPSV